MVIKGFGKLEFNPIRTMSVIGLGLANDNKDENCLFNLYIVWSEYL